MRPRPGIGFIVLNTALLWLATAVGAWGLWPIYQSSQIVIVVAASLALGSAIAIAGALLRWSTLTVALAGVAVFIVTGVPLAVPTKAYDAVFPTIAGLGDLLTGVALGWKQLLTISLPVGQYEALLVPSFALLLVSTVASLTAALRARFGGLAVLGPVVVFMVGIAFGPSSSSVPALRAVALLVAILAWLVWRRWYRRSAAIRRLAVRAGGDRADARVEVSADTRFVAGRTAVSAGIVVLLASVSAVGATMLVPPATGRHVLRSSVEQPFDPRAYVSPLVGFRNYWQQPTVDSVMFSVRGLPARALVRVATLDSYDGVAYSVGSAAVNGSSGIFERIPYRLNQTGVQGTRASLTVAVQQYSGVWLPTVGALQSVAFTGKNATVLRDAFYYNTVTGTAAVIGGVTAGDTYSLDVVVPFQPSSRALARLDPGAASVPSIGAMPAALTATLTRYTADATTPGEKLVAAIDGLRRDGYISHGVLPTDAPSRSGESADRIDQLLTDQRMIGDAEQYAVSAALMARQIGYPARVVLGFVPETTGVGASQIRGKDVSAWIEVDTAQFGWVTIDPNPAVRPIPAEQPKDPNQVARPQAVVPPPAQQAQIPDRQPVPDTQQHDSSTQDGVLAVVLTVLAITGWTLLVALVLASPLLAIVGLKWRKRRLRRRAETPLQQIVGGWDQFEDRALDYGYSPPPSSTRNEVAAVVGGSRTAVLAAVADRATFSPGSPTAVQADLVWRSVEELEEALDRGKTRWQKLKSRISLRSLGGYSVSNLFKR